MVRLGIVEKGQGWKDDQEEAEDRDEYSQIHRHRHQHNESIVFMIVTIATLVWSGSYQSVLVLRVGVKWVKSMLGGALGGFGCWVKCLKAEVK